MKSVKIKKYIKFNKNKPSFARSRYGSSDMTIKNRYEILNDFMNTFFIWDKITKQWLKDGKNYVNFDSIDSAIHYLEKKLRIKIPSFESYWQEKRHSVFRNHKKRIGYDVWPDSGGDALMIVINGRSPALLDDGEENNFSSILDIIEYAKDYYGEENIIFEKELLNDTRRS